MNVFNTWYVAHVLPALYLNDVINNIGNGVDHVRGGALTIFLFVAALMFVVGAYFYSGGDDGKRKAKTIWICTGIATMVALVAPSIINYIKGAMGGGF